MKWYQNFIYIFCFAFLIGCGGPDSSTEPDIDEQEESADFPTIDDVPEEIVDDRMTILNTFSVSGSFAVYDYTVLDSDINDPSAEFIANDPNLSDAQPIPNPVTLGGYLNQPNAGAAGRSQITGDTRDYFRVNLQQGQFITLRMSGSPSTNDLDLYLYDESGNLVDASADNSVIEQLEVPSSGTHYILVEAWDGLESTATNYVLSISNESPYATSTYKLSTNFIAGDVAARLAPSFRSLSKDNLAKLSNDVGLNIKSTMQSGEVLFSIDPLKLLASYGWVKPLVAGLDPLVDEKALKLQTMHEVKRLQRRFDIENAAPNFIYETLQVPNDPLYNTQWHYENISLPAAWDITTGDESVIVAICDTGIVLNHPDLQGQLVTGYDFISDPGNALDGDGMDPNPDDPGDQAGGSNNSSFHGTHVGGTVAAASNNNIGVAGVAWGVKLMPLRTLGFRGGSSWDISASVLYAAGLPNSAGVVPDQPADIINLSLGGSGGHSFWQSFYDRAREAGLIIIAAAGNSGNNAYSYPASYDGVISVGSTSIRNTRSYFSQYNDRVDVAAPGGEMNADYNGDGFLDGVMSTLARGGAGNVQTTYSAYQGTSMATPHMAGVVALMKSVNPTITPDTLDQLLLSGQITRDLGAAGYDHAYGWGLIDAHKAVLTAGSIEGGTPPDIDPILNANPSALNFSNQLDELPLSVRNGGGGDLNIESVSTDDVAWLTVVATNVDEAGLGDYSVQVNRDGLQEGNYSATITVVSNVNTETVNVSMNVTARTGAGNAGTQYILLLDEETGDVVADTTATASNGIYVFNLTDVSAGTYILVAGSDLNNDGFICDAGESCGGYPYLFGADNISVSTDVTGIEFSTGFSSQIWAQNTSAAKHVGDKGIKRYAVSDKKIKR